MRASPTTLDDLQRWLLAAITDPARCDRDCHGVLRPSQQQSAAERLGVYQHAYIARLLDVLRELFPCTRFAVGDDLFDEFAAGYLRRYPPHSYTLARLADKWVDYLDETRPADADWGGFVVELAKLEQAIDRIFDGPGPEGLPPFSLPADRGSDVVLTLMPGLELHAFTFPVSEYFTRWKADRQPAWPERQEQFVALLRRDYIVRRYELPAPQYQVLSAIAGGQMLSEALQCAAESTPTEVRAWFERWASEGFFAAAVTHL